MSALFRGNPLLQPPYYAVVVTKHDHYLDGGTLCLDVVINEQPTTVHLCRRLSHPETNGVWFDRYPGHEGATRLPEDLVHAIEPALTIYMLTTGEKA